MAFFVNFHSFSIIKSQNVIEFDRWKYLLGLVYMRKKQSFQKTYQMTFKVIFKSKFLSRKAIQNIF
jgi:hypothetical protein